MVVIARMIVIVVVPIAFSTPAMFVFIPPAVAMVPAIAACSGQFGAVLCGLGTVPAVMFDGFMELVIGASDAFLAVIFCAQRGRCCKKQDYAETRGRKNPRA